MMQFFIDTTTQKVFAFNPDVIVTGAPGELVFTTSDGTVLGPYPNTLIPFTPPAPTQAQLDAQTAAQNALAGYQAAILNGLIVTSAGTPTLSATYACDPQTCFDMMAEAQFISAFGEFTNLTSTDVWPDITGETHTFPSTIEFMALAKAQAQYVAACKLTKAKIAAGENVSFPSNIVSIP